MGLLGYETTVKSINHDASPRPEATNGVVDGAWTSPKG